MFTCTDFNQKTLNAVLRIRISLNAKANAPSTSKLIVQESVLVVSIIPACVAAILTARMRMRLISYDSFRLSLHIQGVSLISNTQYKVKKGGRETSRTR